MGIHYMGCSQNCGYQNGTLLLGATHIGIIFPLFPTENQYDLEEFGAFRTTPHMSYCLNFFRGLYKGLDKGVS